MTYIKASLARHELAIAKFYFKRDAYVATANRVVSMLKLYPDTQATLDALPLMKASYEKMNLTHLADQTAKIIAANEGKKFDEPEKPKEPELKAPQESIKKPPNFWRFFYPAKMCSNGISQLSIGSASTCWH